MVGRKSADVDKAAEQTKAVESTKAAKIWDKIRNAPIEIYALPNQVVADHVKREQKLEAAVPDSLHLTLKSAAVLPALEESLHRVRLGSGEKFDISQQSVYTVVKIVPKDY